MVAYRVPLTRCVFLLALPFCTSQTSRVHELVKLGGQDLRASNGRSILQVTRLAYGVFFGDADGGLTLGSIVVSSISQVLGTINTTFTSDLDSNFIDAFASNLEQIGCGVLQMTGTGSPRTSFVAFQNFTHVQPPNVYKTRDTNTRIDYSDFSKYTVGQTAGAGRPAVFVKFPYPYSITPMTFNKDTVTQTTNISATFRPVGKDCSSATFGNDGQQASPVLLRVIGEDILNRTTGGSLRRLLVANATCIAIKADILNAPTVDQLNVTLNFTVSSLAKLGVTGPLLNKPPLLLQPSFRASSTAYSYSAYYADLDPSIIYSFNASGSGPTRNAVMVSVRLAILTQKNADCGTQLLPSNLSLAQPPPPAQAPASKYVGK